MVSASCTFSAGCPGEPDEAPLPERTLGSADGEWIPDAYELPGRVACQYAIYPLGASAYMDTIYEVIALAKQSPSYKAGTKTHFCTMLDGDGQEVFDVLRASFALARERCGHVVMTATITCNQGKWKQAAAESAKVEEPTARTLAGVEEQPPFYESYEAVLGELDVW